MYGSRLGETPLHIAIVYNDLDSVKLLIKHGSDVNQRVLGHVSDPEQHRNKHETKKGRRDRVQPPGRRRKASEKPLNPQNTNPESKLRLSR